MSTNLTHQHELYEQEFSTLEEFCRDFVNECDVLIAAPGEFVERKRGSGTWGTVRYARKLGRPLVIIWPDGVVVWPDGSTSWERDDV